MIPGAVFITLYRSGLRDIPSVNASFQENLALYLIAAIPIHGGLVFNYFVVRSLLSVFGVALPVIRYDLAIKLLSGGRPDAAIQSMFSNYTWHILVYLLISFILAAILAILIRRLIKSFFLDLIYPVLRLNSTWSYFFNGEQQVLRRVAQENTFRRKFGRAARELHRLSKNSLTFVSLAIEHGGNSYLYWGVLYDYRVQGDELVQIILAKAQRRLLENEEPTPLPDRPLPSHSERFYPIRGAYIAFDASEIKSINVEFY